MLNSFLSCPRLLIGAIMHVFVLIKAEKYTRANSLCYMRNDCVALALLVCTIFRRGGNAFSKMLRNYTVRVDMLRDLRLAGAPQNALHYMRLLFGIFRYHEHWDRTFRFRARTHIRYVHTNANVENKEKFVIHELKKI